MASGHDFKWSRNLREEHVTEANRIRLIERQRQLLESKRQRQPQVTASRLSKSAVVSSSRSSDRLLDEGRDELHGLLNQSLSPETELPEKQQESAAYSSKSRSPPSQPSDSSEDNLSDVVVGSSPDAGSPESEHSDCRSPVSRKDLTDQKPNPLTTILTMSELLDFVSQEVHESQVFQCTIIRDKRGIDRSLYPTYFMYLQMIMGGEDGHEEVMEGRPDAREKVMKHLPSIEASRTTRQVFLMCGRRRKKSKTYLIGLDPFEMSRTNCVAKLKSNVIGTQFRAVRVSRSGQRSEEACIVYDTNVLGFKGPRKMTAFLPKRSEAPLGSLFEGYKRNKGIIQLKNKTPVWNEDSQSYVLNFHGRVTQASVKNFQLMMAEDSDSPSSWDPGSDPHKSSDFAPTLPATTTPSSVRPLDPGVCLQFGRVSDKEFTCDISAPLSPLQAFAIALSSFDSKLACE